MKTYTVYFKHNRVFEGSLQVEAKSKSEAKEIAREREEEVTWEKSYGQNDNTEITGVY